MLNSGVKGTYSLILVYIVKLSSTAFVYTCHFILNSAITFLTFVNLTAKNVNLYYTWG